VTGATGFLGRPLVAALDAQGFRVRILTRRDPVDPLWRDLAIEAVPGDLDDRAALSRLCDGADVLVHAAGIVKARRPADFEAVNAGGARRVAEAARDVDHVVLVSSLSAREPQLSPYAASKRAGESAMAEVLAERLTIARPCAIYGPGDRELLPVFRAAAALPVLPILSETARIAMIEVSDAARAVADLARTRPGGVVALCDDHPQGYLWRELMAAAARAVGKPARFIPAPPAIVRWLGLTNDFTRLFGAAPMLTSAKARELLHENWAVSAAERINAPSGAAIPLEDGFAATAAWYRSATWMKQ
jgi:nucleoside-diphosphate-sugar epimerase